MTNTTHPPTNQPNNRGASTVCLAIPALTVSLGSVTDTLNYNWDCAYANELSVAVEDLDVGKLSTITQEVIDLMQGHNFVCKAEN
jgi:hypothetical protein